MPTIHTISLTPINTLGPPSVMLSDTCHLKSINQTLKPSYITHSIHFSLTQPRFRWPPALLHLSYIQNISQRLLFHNHHKRTNILVRMERTGKVSKHEREKGELFLLFFLFRAWSCHAQTHNYRRLLQVDNAYTTITSEGQAKGGLRRMKKDEEGIRK